MPDAWHVVIRETTGEAVSLGTQLASPLRDGLAVVHLSTDDAEAIMAGRAVWDATTRCVSPCTPPIPDVTADQLRLWMLRCLGMTPPEIDDAMREASELV